MERSRRVFQTCADCLIGRNESRARGFLRAIGPVREHWFDTNLGGVPDDRPLHRIGEAVFPVAPWHWPAS